MDDVLIGSGPGMVRVAGTDVAAAVRRSAARMAARTAFLTEAHARVRTVAVLRMRAGARVTTDALAAETGLPVERVTDLLADLERNLFFAVRAEDGAVAWAFPVAADPTPHRLTDAGGERVYAA